MKELQMFGFVLLVLCDWSRKCLPPSFPIIFKTNETNLYLALSVFGQITNLRAFSLSSYWLIVIFPTTFNTLLSDMHILNNSLYTFPFLLMRRICLGLIQGWLRRENMLIVLCYNNTTLKIIFSSHLVSYKFTWLMWSHNNYWDVFFIKFMCRRNTSKLGVLVLEWIKSSHLRQTPSCLKMIRR